MAVKIKQKLTDFKSSLLHKSFKIGIFIKGIDGILETAGGIILIFINLIANFIVKLSHKFSINMKLFGIIYLISHGLTKVFLVTMLWKGRSWAYPVTIIFLIIFVLYQFYRYSLNNSIFMAVLSFLDIIIIILTWIEYRRIRKSGEFE